MTRASTSLSARPRAAIGWLTPILLTAAGSAAADPLYLIDASISDPEGTQTVSGNQGTPIVSGRSQSTGYTGAAVSVGFSAFAKPGELGSMSSVAELAPGAPIGGGAAAIVEFTLDNIKIIDPSLAAGTKVNYTINFEIDGKLSAAAFGSSGANADVGLSYDGVVIGTATASTVTGGSSATGIFSGGVSDVKTHTPLEPGSVGGDALVSFELSTSASASAAPTPGKQGQGSAIADFLDPFSFATNGPVFNFFDANGSPLAGVTVDSSDGCIVNNRFVCGGGAGGGGTHVPEPSTWTMFLLGFGGLGYARWHRRRGGATYGWPAPLAYASSSSDRSRPAD